MMELRAAIILHEAGQPINDENVKKVLASAGANVEDAKIKALVASLKDINIDEALKESVSFAAPQQTADTSEKKEEKSEEDEAKAAESASAGLSSLFG